VSDDKKLDAVRTVPAKHIFLDVVDFSRDRSVEAQSYIVAFLNRIVLLSLKKHNIADKDMLLLPTGDGMCISLLNIVEPYDIHLRLALSIYKYIDRFQGDGVDEITEESADAEKPTRVLVDTSEEYLSRIRMREFRVRIGLDANIDNLVTDINGRANIAGAGINMAQRIMNLADGGQILLSPSVVNELRQREQYMRSFVELPSKTVKHGMVLRPFQYVGEGHEGLNTEYPSAFPVPAPQQPKQLTTIAAYYFAHSIRHKAFLIERYPGTGDYAAEAFLWLLAKDSVEKSEAVTDHQKARYNESRIKKTIEELYNQMEAIGFTILHIVHERLYSTVLSDQSQYFEGYEEFRFLTPEGVEKLKQEKPDIWAELVSDGVVENTESA
jgi:class 3 adenylate cyclase